MNKKLTIFGVLIAFVMVGISFASAVSSNIPEGKEKKVSPLYKIRIKQSVRERVGNILESIKSKFLGERLFFLSPRLLLNSRELSLATVTGCIPTKGYSC
jgi:hypothetical protein